MRRRKRGRKKIVVMFVLFTMPTNFYLTYKLVDFWHFNILFDMETWKLIRNVCGVTIEFLTIICANGKTKLSKLICEIEYENVKAYTYALALRFHLCQHQTNKNWHHMKNFYLAPKFISRIPIFNLRMILRPPKDNFIRFTNFLSDSKFNE